MGVNTVIRLSPLSFLQVW